MKGREVREGGEGKRAGENLTRNDNHSTKLILIPMKKNTHFEKYFAKIIMIRTDCGHEL